MKIKILLAVLFLSACSDGIQPGADSGSDSLSGIVCTVGDSQCVFTGSEWLGCAPGWYGTDAEKWDTCK